jgi:hypothetical protein
MRFIPLTNRLNLAAALIFAAVLGSSVYAFTQSNSMPASLNAGSGATAISGYTITSVAYTTNAATPTNLDSVAFTINPNTATSVKIQLAAAGAWYTCANAAGSVTCNTTVPQATVSGASQLTVVATE